MQQLNWGGVPTAGCAEETQAGAAPRSRRCRIQLVGGQVVASSMVIVAETVAPADADVDRGAARVTVAARGAHRLAP